MRGGWYHTGDLGYRTSSGRFHHVGRLKEMIRRGGENISAAQVEERPRAAPGVSVALIGSPTTCTGEVPKAFVQLIPTTADAGTAHDILDHARGHLARFKVPAYLSSSTASRRPRRH